MATKDPPLSVGLGTSGLRPLSSKSLEIWTSGNEGDGNAIYHFVVAGWP